MAERVRHRVTLFKGRRRLILKVFVGVCQYQQGAKKVAESGRVAEVVQVGQSSEEVRNQAKSEECAESGGVADDVQGLARLRRLKGERGARERRRLALLYLAFACDDRLWQGSAYGRFRVTPFVVLWW